MNSFFIRIYAGLILSSIIIGSLSYGGIHFINKHRSSEYREKMARGTFYLLARSIERQQINHQDNDERNERHRRFLSNLIGSEIEILNPEEVVFNASEWQTLEEGKVLVEVRDEDGTADIYYYRSDSSLLLHTEMNKVSEQQARATAVLLLDELNNSDHDHREKEIDHIQSQFGYEIGFSKADDVSLDIEQRQRLIQREVVLAFNDAGSRSKSSVMVYALVDQDKVLVLGPLMLFDWMPLPFLMLVVVWGLVAMALVTYLLSRPLQQRLAELDSVVRRVGSGDLEARVEKLTADSFGQLGATVNGMTQHIQRLIEAQQEIMRAVSHELRTPVARLRFGIDMMADTEDKEQRLRQLGELDNDIEQLNQLIDEILTFARLEQGSPALSVTQIDVQQLLQSLFKQLSQLRQGVQLQDVSPWQRLSQNERFIEADEKYLLRLLQNLVTNALRYAEKQITVRYYILQDQAVFSVEDDGPGIPKADWQRIFEPFARMDQSRNRGSGGYGLGLSIVKRIVQWHGGSINIEVSSLGGAKFLVSLPRLQRKPHALAQEEQPKGN